MFEQVASRKRQRFPIGPAIVAVVVHITAAAAVLHFDGVKKQSETISSEVTFFKVSPPAVAAPPPPPPPPRGPRRQTSHTVAKTDARRVLEAPRRVPEKIPEPREPAPAPEASAETSDSAAAAEGGESGGVEGGVVGGVVGGIVGGVVGAELPPPKNVPAFVIQRDLLQQSSPVLPEVFKQSHRGERLLGMYRVCVGLDGHVTAVTVVKSVPGADEAIQSGIRERWVYKPQQVPVCFLYNMPITVQ
jgi:protein TonB